MERGRGVNAALMIVAAAVHARRLIATGRAWRLSRAKDKALEPVHDPRVPGSTGPQAYGFDQVISMFGPRYSQHPT